MSDWTLILSGGPRNGDRISTPELLPFLKFTVGGADGSTTDHYYAPTESDPSAMTATYEPVDTPDQAVAQIWEQGYEAGVFDGTLPYQQNFNPYRRRT